MIYGLIESKLTGKEDHYYNIQPLSSFFEHKTKDAIDQGSRPICVPCSVSVYLTWEYKKQYNLNKLFEEANGTKEGTSFINMLSYLKHEGLIRNYALVHTEQSLKTAIYLNGPCVAGLPVRDSESSRFWIGDKIEGYHAVSIIGWNNNGFILQNSWGSSWGNYGKAVLPYTDFRYFREIWTLIK